MKLAVVVANNVTTANMITRHPEVNTTGTLDLSDFSEPSLDIVNLPKTDFEHLSMASKSSDSPINQPLNILRPARVRRDTDKLCFSKSSPTGSEVCQKAICPWRNIEDYNKDRDPPLINKAQCDCHDQCLSLGYNARCRELHRPIQVRVKRGSIWVNAVEMVPVACVCAFN